MLIYNLIEDSDMYSITSVNLGQYYRDKPVLENNCCIVDFPTWRLFKMQALR